MSHTRRKGGDKYCDATSSSGPKRHGGDRVGNPEAEHGAKNRCGSDTQSDEDRLVVDDVVPHVDNDLANLLKDRDEDLSPFGRSVEDRCLENVEMVTEGLRLLGCRVSWAAPALLTAAVSASKTPAPAWMVDTSLELADPNPSDFKVAVAWALPIPAIFGCSSPMICESGSSAPVFVLMNETPIAFWAAVTAAVGEMIPVKAELSVDIAWRPVSP